MKFEIMFTSQAQANLGDVRKRDQQVILDAIEVQLMHEPGKRTRNRKRLEENPIAPWELRVGAFRVFFDIDEQEGTVVIVAVGHKTHNTLYIGGEEIEL